MKSQQGLCIGITLGLYTEDESLWSNGIKQNALYLAKLLQHSPFDYQVLLLNTTDVAITDKLPWDLTQFPCEPYSTGQSKVDFMIALGGAIPQPGVDELKARGCRVVFYKCGSEYVVSSQGALFDLEMIGIPYFPQGMDEIWVIPQVANTTRHFLQTLYRTRTRVVPFIWDPMFLEEVMLGAPDEGCYVPHAGPKRLVCMEPNTSILKYCMYPLLIADEAFRVRPELIQKMHVTNTRSLREKQEFVAVVSHLDIVRQDKCFFEDTFVTGWFLKNYADVVVSHQWENPLNYFYFDVCWLGYPLVHNASLCAGLGYYYEGFDVQHGKRMLLQALEHHDRHADDYRAQQRTLIGRHLATHEPLIAHYDGLINEVLSRS